MLHATCDIFNNSLIQTIVKKTQKNYFYKPSNSFWTGAYLVLIVKIYTLRF